MSTRIVDESPANDASRKPAGERESSPLADRIERTQLRIRVRALERELEASERGRREIIAQYERVLADQQDRSNTTANSQSRLQTYLDRLGSRLRLR